MNDLFYKYLSLKNVIFLIAVIVMIFFGYKNIDMTLMLFVSLVIACSLNPLVDKLEKKMGRRKASLLVLGTFVLLLIVFILPILLIGVYEIKTIAASFIDFLKDTDKFVESNRILKTLGVTKANVMEHLSAISMHTGTFVDKTIDFFKGFGSTCVYMFISLIFTYFFMADRDRIKGAILKLFPTSMRKRTEEIFDATSNKIGGYIVAQFYAIASVGIVMAIGLLIFRVDYAIILALIVAILDIVPILGPAIALLICLVATYESGVLPVAAVIVTFTAAQLIENNVVRPYAFSKLLNLHPILIFGFLYLGAKYFGVIGALFAPAIAAFVCVFIEEIYMKSIE